MGCLEIRDALVCSQYTQTNALVGNPHPTDNRYDLSLIKSLQDCSMRSIQVRKSTPVF